MLQSFFKIALRNLLRYRAFSLINIIGLTMGIACALFIFLVVKYELSYDRYHAKADRIYRINKGSPKESTVDYDTGTPQGLAPILREEFPEIENVAVIFKLNPEKTQIKVNEGLTREKDIYFVQPQFFQLFDFTWKQGNPQTALDDPNEVVISESLAQKFFNGDALGKTIRLNNVNDLIVTGVIQDAPINSDFPVQIAISHATLEQSKDLDSYNPNDLDNSNSYYQTYVLLKPGVDALALGPKFKKMVERHKGKEHAEKFLAFSTIALNEIHYRNGNFNGRTISKEAILTLRVIGIFILIIACINFINLASAQAIKRSKEVGIRKTLGSSRKSLILQFLGETFLVTLASLLTSYVAVSQLTLFSKDLTDIPLSPEGLSQPDTLLFMAIVLLGVTLLSGFYPAFVLSGFKPVAALKNSALGSGVKGLFVRKGLIAFQFIISQVLIVCTLIVIRQTDYFNSMSLGFNKEAVLTVDIPLSDETRLSTLKNNLLQYPEIQNVSFSLNTPSATINKWWSNLSHTSFSGDVKSVEVKLVDSAYFKMFEIERVAGSLRIEGDSGRNVVVNQTLVKEIGIRDPSKAIGEKINYWGNDATIVGVVKDFNTLTLHEGMHPVLLTRFSQLFQKASVKIDMNQSTQAIRHLEKHWKEAFPDYYFTYAFLDDQLSTFYKEERKMSRLLVAFASVAISIGCVGLLGLILFVSVQRTKEVGIRKILGATIANIVTLLSMEFIVLVGVAGLIAWPIAWYAMHHWLQGFANRISLVANSWIFIFAAVLSILFALLTVSFQSIKAALANPADSLRSE